MLRATIHDLFKAYRLWMGLRQHLAALRSLQASRALGRSQCVACSSAARNGAPSLRKFTFPRFAVNFKYISSGRSPEIHFKLYSFTLNVDCNSCKTYRPFIAGSSSGPDGSGCMWTYTCSQHVLHCSIAPCTFIPVITAELHTTDCYYFVL